ncbi:uncharacterized protein HD556DRAFT_1308998 [Suillus plorans]|uniref:Secreted protein n=1 Tax=Suillus plorans TaxID=116603 RepID=A0A9P7AQE3_9AGAM|nr:uncharacterized protein HD556DRAFT_1308998 [Suillus plorans]KAG1792973.1 hypothetical protein HD556DRAFT_1308998 [Suillus plorans]
MVSLLVDCIMASMWTWTWASVGYVSWATMQCFSIGIHGESTTGIRVMNHIHPWDCHHLLHVPEKQRQKIENDSLWSTNAALEALNAEDGCRVKPSLAKWPIV